MGSVHFVLAMVVKSVLLEQIPGTSLWVLYVIPARRVPKCGEKSHFYRGGVGVILARSLSE